VKNTTTMTAPPMLHYEPKLMTFFLNHTKLLQKIVKTGS